MASEHGAIQTYVNCLGCIGITVVIGLIAGAVCLGIAIGRGH